MLRRFCYEVKGCQYISNSNFCIFVGCNKETNSSSPATSSSIENKKDEQNDIEEIRKKLSDASNCGESNPIERTMEESIEYTKQHLPKGAKEVKTSFKE